MVYFKVTDGTQTRRFQATCGQFTYDELKQKLASLFPEAVKEDSDLILRYQDVDGDIITLSSDQELQEALSELPKDRELKFHLSSPLKSNRRSREMCPARTSSLFHHLLEPSWGRSSDLFADIVEKEAKEFVDLLHRIQTPTPPSSDTTSHKEEATREGNEDSRKEEATREGNADSHATTSPDGETSVDQKDQPKKEGEVGDEEEVKSKPSSGAGGATDARDGHEHSYIKSTGSWGPFLLGESLFGPVGAGVFGTPVGYRISWTPRHTHRSHHTCSCSQAA